MTASRGKAKQKKKTVQSETPIRPSALFFFFFFSLFTDTGTAIT